MKSKFAQVSIFEMTLAVILVLSSLVYFGMYTFEDNPNTHLTQEESMIETLYVNSEFRYIVMNEDLSLPSSNQNWTNITLILNNSFGNYEIIISNNTDSKTIFSCTEISGKDFSEKLISITSNDNYEFRKVTFGVCY